MSTYERRVKAADRVGDHLEMKEVMDALKKGQMVPYFETILRHAPTAQIEVMEGLGHFPQIDAPDETNALLASFIGRISGKAR